MSKREPSNVVAQKIMDGTLTLDDFAEMVNMSREELAQEGISNTEDLVKLMEDRPRLEAEATQAWEREMDGVNEVVNIARTFLDDEPDRLTALSMFYSTSKDEFASVEVDAEAMQNTLIFLAFALAEARQDLERMAALTVDGNRRRGGKS